MHKARVWAKVCCRQRLENRGVSFLENWASVGGLGKTALEGTLGPCSVLYVMETHSGGLQKSGAGLQCDASEDIVV